MNDSRWYTWVAAGLAFAVVVGLLTGIGLGSQGSGAPAPSGATAIQGNDVDNLYLTIGFNPVNGMDEYFPANFTVAAHVEVHFVITNYDNGINLLDPQYLQVTGTLGNSETYDNSSMAAPVTGSSVSPTFSSHTFTLMGYGYNLNAPIPAATDSANPTTVSFYAYFNTTGAFSWNCMAPCDSGSMATPGYMAGIVTVVTP
jgi:hypothetical protein